MQGKCDHGAFTLYKNSANKNTQAKKNEITMYKVAAQKRSFLFSKQALLSFTHYIIDHFRGQNV